MRLPRQPEQTLFDNLSRYRGVRAARRSPGPAYYAGEGSDFGPTGCEGPTLRFFAERWENRWHNSVSNYPFTKLPTYPIPLWLIGSAPQGLRSSPWGVRSSPQGPRSSPQGVRSAHVGTLFQGELQYFQRLRPIERP